MRQASIDISLNTARLHAQTQACRDMAREQAAESQGLASRGAQIAAMSEETSASVGEIASTFHDQMEAARKTLDQLNELHERVSRSDEHTSELQSLMRNSYAVFCLKK